MVNQLETANSRCFGVTYWPWWFPVTHLHLPQGISIFCWLYLMIFPKKPYFHYNSWWNPYFQDLFQYISMIFPWYVDYIHFISQFNPTSRSSRQRCTLLWFDWLEPGAFWSGFLLWKLWGCQWEMIVIFWSGPYFGEMMILQRFFSSRNWEW